MPFVSAPVVALPRHQVSTEELLDHLSRLYADHPRLAAVQRVIRATTVRSRWYTRPLAQQFAVGTPLGERMAAHLRDSVQLAERAAQDALLEARLRPQDVDGLVVTSATGHTMPGLDILLAERLGLPATARRVAVTQLGCAGGAFALSRAADLVNAGSAGTVLVVCADVFSHYLHRADTGMDGMIFKGLIGDAAGACVVRRHGDGPALELLESWEFLSPGSEDIVGSRIDDDGLHAHNAPRLMETVREVMPTLREWLGESAREFVVSHTGSPKILDGLAEGLGFGPEAVGLARDSLQELGNIGSVSVLDVMERTFAKPPRDGAGGVVVAVGPGVTVQALRVRWHEDTVLSGDESR